MAVAARPGPSDARVPCPLCGGLIHPIAGKCKHCKADLTSYHAARPAANTPLPALHPSSGLTSGPTSGSTAGANGHASGRANPNAAPAPANHAAPVSVAAAYDASQPVLPPRPTDRSYAAEPRTSGLRSWPVLVIILATVAIVVAVVLMVWPSSQRDLDGKHTIAPPAPDRMQTVPEIKPPSPQVPDPQVLPAPPQNGTTPDPWSGQLDPRPSIDPDATDTTDTTDTTAPTDPVDPLATTDDDDLDSLQNPFASPRAPTPVPGHRRLQLNGRNGMMMLAMMEHVCRKMLQCSTNAPTTRSTCNAVARMPPATPANCPAADRCLQRIDAMSCGSQADNFSQLGSLMLQFHDCAEAIRC